jgi:hypothetical protein
MPNSQRRSADESLSQALSHPQLGAANEASASPLVDRGHLTDRPPGLAAIRSTILLI